MGNNSTTLRGYGGASGPIVQALGPNTKPPSSGTLPFTGFDLLTFVILALLLGGIGFMMRWAGRE